MFDNSTNFDTTKDDEVSIPGLLTTMATGGMDLKEYAVRIDRFQIDEGLDDISRLESLYSRGLDGSGDTVIMKEKSFTDQEKLIVVVFYLEKKLVEDPSSILKKLQESEE